jgi:hypothetical protein
MFTLYLKKVQRVKYLNGVLRKINYIDFLGVETFLSTFPKQNLDIGVGMMEEIGVNNFKYNTRSMPMMKSVAFIGGCCFVLVLRMGEWNELTGHPKDRGKNRRNSRMNSLQPGEDDANRWSNCRRPFER